MYLLDFGTAGIERMITLGSPHQPPPEDVPGVIDQTRGLLTFCSQACPGAYHSEVLCGLTSVTPPFVSAFLEADFQQRSLVASLAPITNH